MPKKTKTQQATRGRTKGWISSGEPLSKAHGDKRVALASFATALPNGDWLGVEVYTQDDGGVYVSQSLRKKGGGIEPGQTCFYCAGKLIGCIKCPKGSNPVGNCITGKVTCESQRFSDVTLPTLG